MPATDGSADLSKDQVQVAALGFVLPVSLIEETLVTDMKFRCRG